MQKTLCHLFTTRGKSIGMSYYATIIPPNVRVKIERSPAHPALPFWHSRYRTIAVRNAWDSSV